MYQRNVRREKKKKKKEKGGKVCDGDWMYKESSEGYPLPVRSFPSSSGVQLNLQKPVRGVEWSGVEWSGVEWSV